MPVRDKYYFLSDLHLGAAYEGDTHAAERRVCAFLDSIKDDAAAIYLLGDVLDYWFEYRHVVPRGFVRFFGKLAELTDAGIEVVWIVGNHDIWIFDYLPAETGVRIVDGTLITELLGKRFLLAHGDGVGHQPAAFRFIRSLFRNRMCQKMFAGIHPRWTVPLAHAWSSHSRKQSGVSEQTFDVTTDPLVLYSREYLSTHTQKIDYFIYGHRHLLVREQIGTGSEMIILGEWIMTFSYAVFDKTGLKLAKWEG